MDKIITPQTLTIETPAERLRTQDATITMPETEKPPKLRNACNECHASKVKCSGERTGCNRCVSTQQTCTYSISMVGKVQNQRKRQARREINRAAWPVSPAGTGFDQYGSPADTLKPLAAEDPASTPRESGTELNNRPAANDPPIQDSAGPDNATHIPTTLNTPMLIPEPATDTFWSGTPEDMFDDGMMFHSSLPSNHGLESGFSASTFDLLDERDAAALRSRRTTPPMHQRSPVQHADYMNNHANFVSEHQINSHEVVDDTYRRGSPGYFGRPASYNGEMETRFDTDIGMPLSSSSLESRCPSIHGSIHSSTQSSSSNFLHLQRRQHDHHPTKIRQLAASKCLVVVTKLQRLAREAQAVTVDVLLATNKSALTELNAILHAEMRSENDGNSSQFSDYFQNSNGYGNDSMDGNPTGLMIYVVALQYVVDLYTQACHLFLAQRRHETAFSSPTSCSSSSTGSGNGNIGRDGNVHAGLPQLDFGTFKIDIADQRRLFAEIIGRELGTALGVCGKVRDRLSSQPGDMSAPNGLLEETFLGIEAQLRRLMEQMRV